MAVTKRYASAEEWKKSLAKRQNEYKKANMITISIRYHKVNDKDVIDWIKQQPNQADYIRQLVRADKASRENKE